MEDQNANLGRSEAQMQRNLTFQFPTWSPCIWLKLLIMRPCFWSRTVRVPETRVMTSCHYPDLVPEPRLDVTQAAERLLDIFCGAPKSSSIFRDNELPNTKNFKLKWLWKCSRWPTYLQNCSHLRLKETSGSDQNRWRIRIMTLCVLPRAARVPLSILDSSKVKPLDAFLWSWSGAIRFGTWVLTVCKAGRRMPKAAFCRWASITAVNYPIVTPLGVKLKILLLF